MNLQNGVAENWLIDFTKQLRVKLPVGQYIVTHARKWTSFYFQLIILTCLLAFAPWMNGALYKTGAYWAVQLAVGDLVDWVCSIICPMRGSADTIHAVERQVLQPGHVHRL
jgi:uncharacterized membrane protein (DUF485 family)